MKLEIYCTCGAQCKAEAPPNDISMIRSAWDKFHTGPGHADTDRATALAADARRDSIEAAAHERMGGALRSLSELKGEDGGSEAEEASYHEGAARELRVDLADAAQENHGHQ